MAVDTAEKRFSMINFGDGTHIHLSFEPDGAVDADDRAHLLDLYSGLSAPLASTYLGVTMRSMTGVGA